MTACVLDASAVIAWALPDEVSLSIERLMDRVMAEGAAAPFFYPAELGNGVLRAQRRGRLSESGFGPVRAELARLPVEIDLDGQSQVWTRAYPLAQTHRLSLYDALYLELAVRLGLPLATFDGPLRAAATREGVTLAV